MASLCGCGIIAGMEHWIKGLETVAINLLGSLVPGGFFCGLALEIYGQSKRQRQQHIQAHSITIEESDSGGYQVVE